MKNTIACLTTSILTLSAGLNVSYAQGSPQAITQQRVDVVQLGSGYRASKITGSPVFNHNNDKVGTIDDLILVPNNHDAYVGPLGWWFSRSGHPLGSSSVF